MIGLMNPREWPKPSGHNRLGSPVYDPATLRAYRLLAGVEQAAVASRLGVTQAAISRTENDKPRKVFNDAPRTVDQKQAISYLDAVDKVLMSRARLVEEGEALAARLAARK